MIKYWKNNRYVKSVQMRCFFWSVFSCIRTEHEDIRISPYSVRMRGNTNQKNPTFVHFSRSGCLCRCRRHVYFILQNISRTSRNLWNYGQIFLSSTKNYLSTNNQVHSMICFRLGARKKIDFFSKKSWFFGNDKYSR